MDHWLLGASVALTGPEAGYGAQIHRALLLALEDETLPADRLVVVDDGSDERLAAAAARRLSSDRQVCAVVGPMNSWTCAVQGPIYHEAGLAHITPSASNPDLAERGWTTFFRACASDRAQARALARLAARLVATGRVAAVHDGTAFGAPLASLFLEEAGRLGCRATCSAGVRTGDQVSVRSAASAIARKSPDLVFVVGLETACREAALALRASGVRAVLIGTDGIKPTKVLVTPGFEGAGPFLTNVSTDAARQAPDFHARMTERGGRHDSIYTVEAYDAARFLIGAVRSCGAPDRARVLQAVRRHEHIGLSGPLRFAASGDRLDPAIGLYRYEGDALVFLGIDREARAEGA